MTTHSDSQPWRERNLERIAQARRILTEARTKPPDDETPPPAESDDE